MPVVRRLPTLWPSGPRSRPPSAFRYAVGAQAHDAAGLGRASNRTRHYRRWTLPRAGSGTIMVLRAPGRRSGCPDR